uniref:Uncharacterized protein n=1 Tax=viral metagenome TaxID=1070528 RepID=A0A6M3JZP1_9ZZZZ
MGSKKIPWALFLAIAVLAVGCAPDIEYKCSNGILYQRGIGQTGPYWAVMDWTSPIKCIPPGQEVDHDGE